jgi:predicted nucleic acid-binding protein
VTVGLDTSIVVRLLIGESATKCEAVHRFLGERALAGEEPARISDLVVSETYFVLRHHYDVPHTKAIAAIRILLADPRLHATGVATDVIRHLTSADTAPGLMDRLIHGDYLTNGATLLTFDRDAARLSRAKLLAS